MPKNHPNSLELDLERLFADIEAPELDIDDELDLQVFGSASLQRRPEEPITIEQLEAFVCQEELNSSSMPFDSLDLDDAAALATPEPRQSSAGEVVNSSQVQSSLNATIESQKPFPSNYLAPLIEAEEKHEKLQRTDEKRERERRYAKEFRRKAKQKRHQRLLDYKESAERNTLLKSEIARLAIERKTLIEVVRVRARHITSAFFSPAVAVTTTEDHPQGASKAANWRCNRS